MPAEQNQPTSPLHEACTVQERIAIGTAGVVYRGVHTSTNREVTFKVLSPASTHPMQPARVLALRWRLEALQHPVIAELIDAYEDPDGFVILTNWVSGGMGGNEFPFKLGTLNQEEARLVATKLCEALLVGEQQQFPHGDIKPSNLILADRGERGLEMQIQDWGLSACREAQPPETLQFMAPERHYGHPASIPGDLFSVGATLWFLLTGGAPSSGSTTDEVLQGWGSFDPAAIAGMRPDLDEHLLQWVAWLLRWQPADRPDSVSQALDVLTGILTRAAARGRR
jgi:serine/threonine protein kinase